MLNMEHQSNNRTTVTQDEPSGLATATSRAVGFTMGPARSQKMPQLTVVLLVKGGGN